jgi:NAD(P)-dependent dehydrogenase (short-subunit alcohol dehydrogenase family)
MKYEIPAMRDGGSIVNVSSTAAAQPVGGLGAYVSAKAGLVGLTRTAALDYAAHGIRVNALAPGPIRTEHLERAGEAAQRHVAAGLPLRRLGRPEEVAAAALWLCGPESAFVTGTTLTIDGGLLAGMPPFAQERP